MPGLLTKSKNHGFLTLRNTAWIIATVRSDGWMTCCKHRTDQTLLAGAKPKLTERDCYGSVPIGCARFRPNGDRIE